MRSSRICIVAVLALLCSATFSQTPKRKPKPKPTPKLDLSWWDKPIETPCGIKYSNFDEVMEDADVEWRTASVTSRELYFYNTKRRGCEKGVVKVWVKGVNPKDVTVTK